jgi:hypothetical protein
MSASIASSAFSGPYRQHLEAFAERETNAAIHADGQVLDRQHPSLQLVKFANPCQHKEIILTRLMML